MNNKLDFASARESVSLADLVQRYVPLHRVGGALRSKQCPFCGEGSSHRFLVDGQKFHCFACKARGDAVDFTAKIRGISLKQAVEMLIGGGLEEALPPLKAPPPDPEAVTVEETAVLQGVQALRKGGLTTPPPKTEAYLAGRGFLPEDWAEAVEAGVLRFNHSTPAAAQASLITTVGLETMTRAGWYKEGAYISAVAYRPVLFFTSTFGTSMEARMIELRNGYPKVLRFGGGGYFNLPAKPGHESRIAFVEGPFDLIAFRALGFKGQVVGLPGAAAWKADEVEALIHNKDQVIIALDNDQTGQEQARALVKKFPRAVVRTPPIPGGDVNDILKSRRTSG